MVCHDTSCGAVAGIPAILRYDERKEASFPCRTGPGTLETLVASLLTGTPWTKSRTEGFSDAPAYFQNISRQLLPPCGVQQPSLWNSTKLLVWFCPFLYTLCNCHFFLTVMCLVCACHTSIYRGLWYIIIDSQIQRLHPELLQGVSCGLTKILHRSIYVLLPDE